MGTVIVGDVDPEKIIKIFSKYFNNQNNNRVPKNNEIGINYNNPIQKTRRIDFKSSEVNDVQLKIGFIGPKNSDIKDLFLLEALKSFINDRENSRNEKV